ncbi:tetratricopeptide repeat protein [Arsenicibacter rosenii]|uniref:Uncharacterized protein n=1 Tax=Arsenicibacter rosenii TaxID=1750698 RepID=A0A1S2VQE6_9BACT|nr:tetratricopeptide repeat protein [Arsenicibacter rosenii]OIN60991.1 hypothetical protein BLX24_02600 [Arsenicibacter rosenii]
MRFFVLILALWLWNWQGFDQISVRNLALKQAEQAYSAGNYARAAEHYSFLIKTEPRVNPDIHLNFGHALFRTKQYRLARQQYKQVMAFSEPSLVATATNQLGVIACFERDTVGALSLFKEAMLNNPADKSARYNYELIKRIYSGKTKPPRQKKPEPAPKQQPKPQQANSETEQSDEQKDVLRKLRNLNMSEEQAMQILNAMRDDDLPYALARRRRQAETKKQGTAQRW